MNEYSRSGMEDVLQFGQHQTVVDGFKIREQWFKW
jgi:hypothetical protein